MNGYQQTVDWLFKQLPVYQRQGKTAFKKDLTNIKMLCQYLDNPHKGFKSIHIAGTNGKGTTSHIIASILQSAGYKVGLYTSPHYVDFRERIKINGKKIPKRWVVDFVKNLMPLINEIKPSFFELTVALAFKYFTAEKVDVAIIETGLGGRLDSTNIITPLLSVITNISFDHESMLGDTLAKIAYEKAGIIKKGIPVLIGEKQQEVEAVFKQKAESQGSRMNYAKDYCELALVEQNELSTTYSLKSNKNITTTITTDLVGNFQQKNLQTAIAAILIQQSFDVSLSNIKNGVENVKKQTAYIGRFQHINQSPNIILDAAHNKAGLKHIFDFINNKKSKNVILVLGFVKDKNVSEIIHLVPKNVKCILTEPKIFRKLPVKQLYLKALNTNRFLPFIENSEVILKCAIQLPPQYIVIFTGSSFIVADILSQIAQ